MPDPRGVAHDCPFWASALPMPTEAGKASEVESHAGAHATEPVKGTVAFLSRTGSALAGAAEAAPWQVPGSGMPRDRFHHQ